VIRSGLPNCRAIRLRSGARVIIRIDAARNAIIAADCLDGWLRVPG
jgi:hypothetical protein